MPKFLKGLVSAAQLTINTLRVVVVVASWTSIPKMILAAVDPPFIVLLPAVNNGEIPQKLATKIINNGNNINFSYDNNKTALKNINLTIRQGETLAIVGSTGSGKTTLVNLLARFYNPINGEILISSELAFSL